MEELAFILDAIDFVASYGNRFLSLYHFDWVTGDWTFHKNALSHALLAKVSITGLKNGDQSKHSHSLFQTYMNDANRIARYLPEHPRPKCIPDDVDPNLVLFEV